MSFSDRGSDEQFTERSELGGGRYLFEIYPRDRIAAFGPATGVVLDALRRISGRDMLNQLCANLDEAIGLLETNGFARTRSLPESELAGAGHAPPPSQRAFALIEAQTQARHSRVWRAALDCAVIRDRLEPIPP